MQSLAKMQIDPSKKTELLPECRNPSSLRKFLDNSGPFRPGKRKPEKGGRERKRKNGSAELEREGAGVKKEENITPVTITRAGAPAGLRGGAEIGPHITGASFARGKKSIARRLEAAARVGRRRPLGV